MILIDTSVWIDHLHRSEPALIELLRDTVVLTHPMVIGELALGSLHDRTQVLKALAGMSAAEVSTHDEVMIFVEAQGLHGIGLSLVDAHLLASTLLTPGTLLWTRDKRLDEVATRLGVGYR